MKRLLVLLTTAWIIAGAAYDSRSQEPVHRDRPMLILKPGQGTVRVVLSISPEQTKRLFFEGAILVSAQEVRIVPHAVGVTQVHCTGNVRVESANFSGTSARLDVSENGNRLDFNADATERVLVRQRDRNGVYRGVSSAQRAILFVAERRMEVRGDAHYY